VLKIRDQRLKWSEQAEPSFNPSALRLEWGDDTVSSRLRKLDLEETASYLQGILLHWLPVDGSSAKHSTSLELGDQLALCHRTRH